MLETTVEVQAGDVRLIGTLCQPDDDGPYPAALLLSGSGPLDRDSNIPGQRLDISKALAEGLAARGVASLRYDKRGVGESGGDFVTATLLRRDRGRQQRVERAPCHPRDQRPGRRDRPFGRRNDRHASRGNSEPPDAYVLLAGAAVPGETVMAWQSRRIAATLPVPWRWFRGMLERRQARDRERLLASTGATLRVRRQEQPAAWLREFMTYDPAGDLAAVAGPVLAITGLADLQVDPADVPAIGRLVNGPFTGETPDDLTHLLRIDHHAPSLRRYTDQLRRPVEPSLVDRVASWTSLHLS